MFADAICKKKAVEDWEERLSKQIEGKKDWDDGRT